MCEVIGGCGRSLQVMACTMHGGRDGNTGAGQHVERARYGLGAGAGAHRGLCQLVPEAHRMENGQGMPALLQLGDQHDGPDVS